ncbi:MAG: zinc ABC transporter solute-binding protein [Methanomicrobiales archaeon]|nr:zinc ABC transporter solute-binding protein [Methanomicrobiales archaeon]
MKNFSLKLKDLKISLKKIFTGNFFSQGFFIFLVSFLLLTSGCINSTLDTHGSDDLTVACTIPPQEEFIRAIAGESNISVLVMVPPGASPHTFEPTPSQIAELEQADLYVALGSGVEFENRWIERIRELYPELTIVNSSRTIPLLSGSGHGDEEKGTDPHVWMSLTNAATIVRETCEGIVEIEPGRKDLYEQNRDTYLEQLNQVDGLIHNSLQDLSSRTILVYHPSLGYFCRDYDLTQMAAEEAGHEPSAQGLADVITRAKTLGITFIFAEPETSTRQAETLAKELNGTVILISPLAGNYLENMQEIAQKIAGH